MPDPAQSLQYRTARIIGGPTQAGEPMRGLTITA